ncbi:hypothetical protein MTO96_033669 [Rhipicephalus appendiculatus]
MTRIENNEYLLSLIFWVGERRLQLLEGQLMHMAAEKLHHCHVGHEAIAHHRLYCLDRLQGLLWGPLEQQCHHLRKLKDRGSPEWVRGTVQKTGPVSYKVMAKYTPRHVRRHLDQQVAGTGIVATPRASDPNFKEGFLALPQSHAGW